MNVESKANFIPEQYQFLNALYCHSALRKDCPSKSIPNISITNFFFVLFNAYALMMLILNLHEFDPFARSVSMHSSYNQR
jgi:hypothetical protein